MASIAAEKYVRLTTYTKDGRPKHVPVWIADLGDGTVGFTTDLSTWKVKRLRHTPAVELVASSSRGAPKDGAQPVSGTATIVTGDDFERVMAAIREKYGWQVPMIQAFEKIRDTIRRRETDPGCGIIVTLQ